MTIAFDIDGTWDRDPFAFGQMAHLLHMRGWTVIITTGREQPLIKLQGLGLLIGMDGDLPVYTYPVIVSGPMLKEQAAIKAGYKVDVWVDDMPGMIQDCKMLGGDL